MRAKCNCERCSTHLEFDTLNVGSVIICPDCKAETTLKIQGDPNLQSSVSSVAKKQAEFMIRWRGRQEGPLPLHEVERRLKARQIGLLTEIQYNSKWITIREFYKEKDRETVELQADSHSDSGPEATQPLVISNSDLSTQEPISGLKARWYFVIAAFILILVAGYVIGKNELTKHTHLATVATANLNSNSVNVQVLTNQSATFPVANQIHTNSETPGLKPVTNIASTIYPSVNSLTSPDLPTEPPLPENESRTFWLKDNEIINGIIVDVNSQGLVFKDISSKLTSRIPWGNLDLTALTREPKVIAYRKSQADILAAKELARIAKEEAEQKTKAQEEQRVAKLTAYRNSQDKLIDESITTYGSAVVTKGYLKAWGSNVSIGEIFAVVAPTAVWSVSKLVDTDPDRYTHYLVEARWINKDSERVAMQYLVTADGQDFHLHGCFVSGIKMDDGPFLIAVKQIWNDSK